jgi:hypothetical protein
MGLHVCTLRRITAAVASVVVAIGPFASIVFAWSGYDSFQLIVSICHPRRHHYYHYPQGSCYHCQMIVVVVCRVVVFFDHFPPKNGTHDEIPDMPQSHQYSVVNYPSTKRSIGLVATWFYLMRRDNFQDSSQSGELMIFGVVAVWFLLCMFLLLLLLPVVMVMSSSLVQV